MIFSIFFTLTIAGYSACGLLLGSYMRHYTGASSLELGFVFMIQPLTVLLRLLISAHADRHQSHKRLLTQCLLLAALAYLPFIVVPFLLREPRLAELLTPRRLFWILAGSHLLGSLGFCGTRTLGDALAVNFAKRTGGDYATYRKFGSISFGTCGLLLGLVNQNNPFLPDFVPAMLFNSSCLGLLAILIYLWPDEYFAMLDRGQQPEGSSLQVPTGAELARRILANLGRCMTLESRAIDVSESYYQKTNMATVTEVTMTPATAEKGRLTAKQQVDIFLLLLRRDIRIPLFLGLLLYGGLAGYAPQNFVYTYIDKTCKERAICDGSELSGLTMLVYCVVETIVYMLVARYRKSINYLRMLQLTLVSLTFHYYFYGFLVDRLSPYFFLMESLHGLEYGLSLSSSCELGHQFASEVELLIPELKEKEIIDKETDQHLVRVSLMATMNGCFTMVYDGLGTVMGALLYGIIIERTSYQTNWIVVATMALVGLLVSILIVQLGKCLGIEPQIRQRQQGTSAERTPPGLAASSSTIICGQ